MTTDAQWGITLALGLVGAIAAVVLLQMFLNHVHRIERAAASVWTTAQQAARNTATTWMLAKTSERLDRLTEEALRHDEFLRGTQKGA